MSRKAGSETEYQLTVSLRRAKRIRRSLVLQGKHTLHDLHQVIFSTFDRFDDHLYCFYLRTSRTGRSAGRLAREYLGPPPFDQPDELAANGQFSAARTRLDSLGLKVGQRIEYLFDFGDSWWHDIHVDRIGPAAAGQRYPAIVDQQGRSPAQYPE